MSKVATYLQEHIQGEVSTDPATLSHMSTDLSVLSIKPEMVVYPRSSSDIRKIARFSWQLAEKGHILPLTVRGDGSDLTGAAIGSGIIIATTAHLNSLFEFDQKQKLIRLQPGLSLKSLNDALSLQGMAVPPLSNVAYGTIGGAVGNNATSPLSGKYGDIREWTHQLEVVLASGDMLQTGRLSKRDLNKKKGLQGFEGQIYRELDHLIEDNKVLIDNNAPENVRDNVGYTSLAKVKKHDGSFDLTPLIVGSQGTLGIVSELILKTDFVSDKWAAAAISFGDLTEARDAVDQLRKYDPTILEFYDGELFADALERGKKYDFYDETITKAVVIIGFDDFSDRARAKKLKKLTKWAQNLPVKLLTGLDTEAAAVLALREVTIFRVNPNKKDISSPPLFDGAYVPWERFEDFSIAARQLAEKHRVSLPLYGRPIENVYSTRPLLELKKVGDKQKVFKLLDEYSNLVVHHGGHLIGQDGEGRLKARFAHKQLDDDILAVFNEVKRIFDPHGILNPGVKQSTDMKDLVSHLRPDYDTSKFADYSIYN
ncbi:MAG: FAD-binding oxidoreductase [Candidatus Saccharimonadales bacterium]